MAALRSGNFAVTDGPALRIAYDLNRNGVIDSVHHRIGRCSRLGEHAELGSGQVTAEQAEADDAASITPNGNKTNNRTGGNREAAEIAFESADVLRPDDLLQAPTLREEDWGWARPGVAFNGRLRSIMPERPPSLESIMQQGRDDIGSQAGEIDSLPPTPDEPSQSATGRSGRGVGAAAGGHHRVDPAVAALTGGLRGREMGPVHVHGSGRQSVGRERRGHRGGPVIDDHDE